MIVFDYLQKDMIKNRKEDSSDNLRYPLRQGLVGNAFQETDLSP
jgi:hypothetical protein